MVPWRIHLGGPADGSGVAPALMRCADEGQETATRVDYGPRNAAGPSVTWEVTDLQPFEGSCFPESDPVEPPLP